MEEEKKVVEEESVEVLLNGARLPVLKEHNFMSSAFPGIPYVYANKVMTREEAPRSWLPPRMQIAPGVEKKPLAGGAPKPARLKMKTAIEIKNDATLFATKPHTSNPQPSEGLQTIIRSIELPPSHNPIHITASTFLASLDAMLPPANAPLANAHLTPAPIIK